MSYHKNTIYETVIQCSFNKDYFNHITNNIYNINEKKYQNFRFQKLNVQGKCWIGLSLEIQTLYQNSQKFFIPIQLLIPDNFPFIPPVVSVCLPGPNTIINPENKDIDQNTCKIFTNLIKKWDWSTSLIKVIEEINHSFNQAFPILQVQQRPNQNINNYIQNTGISPNCQVNMSPNSNQFNNPNFNQYNSNQINDCNIRKNDSINSGIYIDINENYLNNKFNSSKGSVSSEPNLDLNWDCASSSSESTNHTKNTNYNDNKNINAGSNIVATPNQENFTFNSNSQIDNSKVNFYDQSINKKNPFSSNPDQVNYNNQNFNTYSNQKEDNNSKIKEILLNEIKNKIERRVLENYFYLKEMNEYLENAKLHMDYRAQKLSHVINNSDDIFAKFEEHSIQKKQEIENLKKINEEKSSKYITKENCFDFISKESKFDSVVNIICGEATIEDILIYIKKAFEKGALNFDETVKNIRSYSRELMKLKFLKDKLIAKYKQ